MSGRPRWLVTGGCGFIGTNLVERAVAEGIRVRVFDDLSVGTREALAAVAAFGESDADASGRGDDPVELTVGDLADVAALAKAAQGVDTMVHLAASTGVPTSVENPRLDCMANVVGTLNALEAARSAGVRRFVFASSGAPAGEVEPPIHEEIVPKPVSPYGASKLAGEAYCSAYARTFGVETVALRFGNVYGPRSGHKSSVVARFFREALAGRPLEVYGDGSQTRDFVFVGDLVEAILLASRTPDVGGEVFQIATARETSVGEVASAVTAALRDAGRPVPELVHASPRVGDVQRNYSDTTKARERLGWQAKTDLEAGLRATLASILGMEGE